MFVVERLVGMSYTGKGLIKGSNKMILPYLHIFRYLSPKFKCLITELEKLGLCCEKVR